LPVLFNHNRDKHIGRATKYNNTGSKIDVGSLDDIIWSESEFAQEKKRDIENGSLVGTSVGYSIESEGELVGKNKDDGLPIYCFKWAPHEFSFCTIEADTTVGVGRERAKSNEEFREILIYEKNPIDIPNTQPKRQTPTMDEPNSPAVPAVDVARERGDAVTNERKRVADIQELATHFKTNGIAGRRVDAGDIAAQHIRDGKTVNDFQNTVIRASLPEVKEVTLAPEIGMSERDISQYSVLRAINGVIGAAKGRSFDGLEREVSDEVARKHGRQPDGLGFFLPPEVMTGGSRERTLFSTGSFHPRSKSPISSAMNPVE